MVMLRALDRGPVLIPFISRPEVQANEAASMVMRAGLSTGLRVYKHRKALSCLRAPAYLAPIQQPVRGRSQNVSWRTSAASREGQ